MKKSHLRDYATAAFRFFAQEGSSKKYTAKLWAEAITDQGKLDGIYSGISNPSEAAIIRAEKKLSEAAAELADLEAVERAIEIIEHMSGNISISIIKALKIVYMAEPQRDLGKGEISERAHKAELDIPASEKTIYRWLSIARNIFAKERGLRL